MSQGVFSEIVELFNRAPENLKVQFDGQSKILTPGINLVPKIVVSFAKNQNPIMGTHDPYNPGANSGQYLVGVVGSKDSVTPLTTAEWETHLGKPCRENFDILVEDKYPGANPRLVVQGKGRKSSARGAFEAREGGVVTGATAETFTGLITRS
jgi:hypothetical protein